MCLNSCQEAFSFAADGFAFAKFTPSIAQCHAKSLPPGRSPAIIRSPSESQSPAAMQTPQTSTRTHSPPISSPDIAPSDLFFLVGWKPSLNGENIMGKMNYMKSWTKVWQTSQSKWSKRSLSTGWIDSNTGLIEMVTTFPKTWQVNFWTEFSNGKHVKIEL
jgi:hypothetical protein